MSDGHPMAPALAERVLIGAGGLAGAAGVGLSAVAAHAGGAFAGTVAGMLMAHAPVLLAVGLLGGAFGGRVLRLGTYCILVGLAMFCGDLLMRDFGGHRLFAMAAPTGGTLMIAGWIVVAVSAFTGRARR